MANLKALCGFIKPDSKPCENTAIDSSGRCYSHSPLRAEQRRKNSSKGGRLGGRGRASISKELGEVRRLIGAVVELKAQDRLPQHLDSDLKSFITLLKLYLSYAQLEVRTAKADELVPKRAFDNQRLIDAKALREEIDDLVYEYDKEHDPTRGGAA